MAISPKIPKIAGIVMSFLAAKVRYCICTLTSPFKSVSVLSSLTREGE